MRLDHAVSGFRWIVFLLMLVGMGCATARPIMPDYLDSSFDPTKVDKIVLLSFVDIRLDKTLPFDLKDFMESSLRLKQVGTCLGDKGYALSFAPDFGQIRSMKEDETRTADASWVKSLGPPDAEWVLLVALKDLSVKLTYGKQATARCLGVLYHKTIGKAVWSHEAVETARAGGLAAMVATDQYFGKDALLVCAREGLCSQLPPKK